MTAVLNAPVTAMPRYRPRTILAMWLAVAGPMGILAWVVAPALAGPDPSPGRFAVCLIAALTAGLVRQFVLVMIVVYRERGSLRWSVLKEALWLRGGRFLWWVLAAIAAVGVVEALPTGPDGPVSRNFGLFIGSSAGHDLLRGNWAPPCCSRRYSPSGSSRAIGARDRAQAVVIAYRAGLVTP